MFKFRTKWYWSGDMPNISLLPLTILFFSLTIPFSHLLSNFCHLPSVHPHLPYICLFSLILCLFSLTVCLFSYKVCLFSPTLFSHPVCLFLPLLDTGGSHNGPRFGNYIISCLYSLTRQLILLRLFLSWSWKQDKNILTNFFCWGDPQGPPKNFLLTPLNFFFFYRWP